MFAPWALSKGLWSTRIWLGLLTAIMLTPLGLKAQSLPSGFQTTPVASGFSWPVLVRFAPNGTMFVVEKAGRVWVHEGGQKSPQPLIDLVDEVNNDHDRGLLGFTIHPGWTPDGGPTSWVYFLYTVSPVFGQDLSYNQNNRYSFGRLKRCRTTLSGGWPVAILADEDGDGEPCQILLGHQQSNGWVNNGIASLHNSHATCDLHFGADGTLLVINGDGAHYNFTDRGGQNAPAFQNYSLAPPPGKSAPWFGPMPLYEDSGAYRSQDLRSLAGKVLRIDPETGLGLASNPYYTGNPADHASKVWAGGLRNPFRSAMVPGTGQTNPAAGNPGAIMLGEVGWNVWEELNVVLGGENFGWPTYEGPSLHPGYSNWLRSPNPLLMPDGMALGGKADPAAFGAHRAPVLAWHHSTPSMLWPAGLHPGFRGNSATGGDYYVGSSYPEVYQGAYFFADYGQGWIRVLRTDGNYQATSVLDFGTNMGPAVDLERHPIVGDLHYVNIGNGTIYRLRYGTNSPPTALATAQPTFGPAPLVVAFDAGPSVDGEQSTDTLRFDWSFGDGSVAPDAGPQVEHTYVAGGTYFATATVTDFDGASDSFTLSIAVDNTPPVALIVSPEDGSLYDPQAHHLHASGAAFDLEDPAAALTLNWTVDLHHMDVFDPSQNHFHPAIASGTGPNFSFHHDDHGGSDDVIAYTIKLKVTDTSGAEGFAESFIFPADGGVYPWVATDLGSAMAAGSDVRLHYRGFETTGSGTGLLAPEGLRFIHKPVTSNFSLDARLDALSGSAGASAGLLARSGLGPDAALWGVVVTGGGTLQVWSRAPGAGAAAVVFSAPAPTPECWLKLERDGNMLRAWVSPGGAWQAIHEQPLALGPHLRVGMMVAGGGASTLATGTFREVELTYSSACGDGIVDAGEQCDDGNTVGGDCCDGLCQYEPQGSACGAGDPCVAQACGSSGICETSFVSGPCDDGNSCTIGDSCAAGLCVGGADLDCQDNDPCTLDTCNPASGCENTPIAGCGEDPDAATFPWKSTDVGGALPGETTLVAPGALNVRAEGTLIWGHHDDFRLVWQPVSGDFTITSQVRSVQNVHKWTKAGVMVRAHLGPDAQNAYMYVTPYSGAWFQWRVGDGFFTLARDGGPFYAPNVWVRLQRQGNMVRGLVSNDGATWILVREVAVQLPETVLVGAGVCSQLAGAFARGDFRHISIETAGEPPPPPVCGNGVIELGETCDDGNTQSGDCCSSSCQLEPSGSICGPASACTNPSVCQLGQCLPGGAVQCDDGDPCTHDVCEPSMGCVYSLDPALCPPPSSDWTFTDIGGPLPASAITGALSSSFQVSVGGVDIWAQADSFGFIHQLVAGDFDLRVRVNSLALVHHWAKAGLMVRTDLAANAKNLMVLVPAGTSVTYAQWRLATAGWTSEAKGPAAPMPNTWLRLTRQGDTITALASSDGQQWTTIHTQNWPGAGPIHVGPAVTSHRQGTATIATFSDLGWQ